MPILMLAAALSGCMPAAHHSQGHWTGRFTVDAPSRWEATRNRRLLGQDRLVLQAPDRCCTIAIERRRETADTRELPLSLLADALPLERGRVHGMVGEPLAHHQISLHGHEAWATTLVQHNGPKSWLVSSIYTRVEGDLYVLTLEAPHGASPSVTRAWERVVGSFDVPGATGPLPPPWEPEPFLDDPPSQPAPSPT